MIKPENVPKEVAWKLQDKLFASGVSVDECTQAIAAALNAWPGVRMMVDIDTGDDAAIKLPLPQEKRDDE